MIKIQRYNPKKVYMFPDGTIATPEAVLEQFPAVNAFTHMIETDESGEILWAVQHLNAMRSIYNIDPALTEDEAMAAIEDLRNAPQPEGEPSAEERIAAALEYQNLLSM